MSKAERLTEDERRQFLANHPAWQHNEARDAISRDLKFKSFGEAWAFMTRIALYAEKINHHPEWSNVYNRVSITLTTHSCTGLSALDQKMARLIDRLVPEAIPEATNDR